MNLAIWKNKISLTAFDGAMVILLFGLFYSRFLMSISAFTIPAVAVWYSLRDKTLKADTLSFFKNSKLLCLLIIPILYLASGLISDDMSEWWRFSKSKIVFFTFPLAIHFYAQHQDLKSSIRLIAHAFVLICIISSFPVLWGFLSDMTHKIALLGKGIPLDTPFNHIIYSLYICFSILIIWIYASSHHLDKKYQIQIYVVLAYLIIFIHILAVRSGIITLYGGFIILTAYRLWKNKNLKKALLAMGSILMIAIFCYQLSPSLQRRISYMKWDLDRYAESGGQSYSDSERLNSLKAGVSEWKKNIWLGVGIGDTKSTVEKYYEVTWSRPNNEVKLPHNQYIFVGLSFGLLGLILWIMSIFYPIRQVDNTIQSEYLITLLCVFALSFMVNNTLERSVGSYLFILALSFILTAVDDLDSN